MKWIAIIAVCLAVVLYGLNRSEVGLEQREDGLYYKTGAETAFTGDGLGYHPNKRKGSRGQNRKRKTDRPVEALARQRQTPLEGQLQGRRKGWRVDSITTRRVPRLKESTWEEGVEQVIFELKPIKTTESPAAISRSAN